MTNILRCIEGTHDYFGENGRRFDKVLATAERIFWRYDYEKITTPIFEATELFARGIGTTTDIVEKEMYTFSPSSESLTLRPEGTAGVIRAYLQHNFAKEQGGVHKLWYAGAMFRRERPQKGRQRQFYQVGVEAIGSNDPLLDAEVISMALAFFAELGITGVTTRLHSIGCSQCRPPYREILKTAIAPMLPQLCKTCQNRYERNVLRVLDCKICAKLTSDLPPAHEHLCGECHDHFTTVQEFLAGLNVEYTIDKTLVRGLDYYTKTIFEFTHSALGAQDALGGGGRYDGLIAELGGKATPAVGLAIGVERVMLVHSALNGCNCEVPLMVYGIGLGEAGKRAVCGLLARLRGAGISADMDFCARSLKAQMRYADKRGALLAIIIGDSELAKGAVVIKDLRHDGKQTEVPLGEFMTTLSALIK